MIQSSRHFGLLLGSACIALLLVARLSASEEDLLYRELAPQPYDVRIYIQWSPTPRFTDAAKEDVIDELISSLQRSVGESWSFDIRQRGPLPVADLDHLREHTAPLEYHVARKTFLVVVEEERAGWQLGVREGDHTTAQWSEVLEQFVDDPRVLAATLHQMLGRVFQPLYRIYGIDRERIDLIAVGGEWSLEDELFQVAPDMGLARPVIIYRNRERKIEQIQTLPLTFLSIGSHDRARVTSRLISAFPAPLGSGRQSRVELWALGAKPLHESSELTLVLQTNPTRVLMGHRVVLQPKRFLKDETGADPMELLSDRHGRLTIERVAGFPVVWLYVWSGDTLLARVPLVPGLNQQESLPLPDDSVRLRVEGELDRLRTDLVADVSRRAINRILMLAAAKKGDREQVDQLKTERRSIPAETVFQSRLEKILTAGVRDAQAGGSRVAVMRIQKACGDMQKVIFQFLDPARDRELESEVDALLKLP